MEDLDLVKISENQNLRIDVGRKSLLLFGLLYLPEYFTFKTAEFQKLFALRLEDDDINRMADCHFRESAKSTLATLIYPLWCICYQKRKFIIIGSETKEQSTVLLSSLISALQSNQAIIEDFGVLYFESRKGFDETKKKTVADFTTENNVRVMAKSKGQAIRGLRHLQYRPDLFIGDDLDSIKSVNQTEQRDKTFNWLKAEVLSGMNQEYGKAIIVGNMIHFDCLMARLKSDLLWNYNDVPIYTGEELSWPTRHFWTKQEADGYNKDIEIKEKRKTSIEQIKRDKGSLIFAQEYLLRPMSESEQIVRPEWIKHYEYLDKRHSEFFIFKGRIDPAIKEKESSDYTAIVIAGRDKRDGKIYIVDAWQRRVSLKKQVDKIVKMHKTWKTIEFGVEDNAYQDALKQSVDERKNLDEYVPTKGITTIKDKTTRLLAIQPLIERGDILFASDINDISKVPNDPRSQGLIDQLIQFPKAPHDDLVDAMTGVVEQLIVKGQQFKPVITAKKDQPTTANLMDKTF